MSYHDFVMENLEQILILSLAMGGLAAFTAKRKGKDPIFWFFIGALFGMLGVFFILFLPSAKKEKKLAYAGGSPQKTTISPPIQQTIAPFTRVEWYYLEEDEAQFGPIDFPAMQQAWQDGKLDSNTLVWNSDLSDWTQISAIDGLKTALGELL